MLQINPRASGWYTHPRFPPFLLTTYQLANTNILQWQKFIECSTTAGFFADFNAGAIRTKGFLHGPKCRLDLTCTVESTKGTTCFQSFVVFGEGQVILKESQTFSDPVPWHHLPFPFSYLLFLAEFKTSWTSECFASIIICQITYQSCQETCRKG